MIRPLFIGLLIFAMMAFAIGPDMSMSAAKAAPKTAMVHHHGADTVPIHCADQDCPGTAHCCDMAHCLLGILPAPAFAALALAQSAVPFSAVVPPTSDSGYLPERPPRLA